MHKKYPICVYILCGSVCMYTLPAKSLEYSKYSKYSKNIQKIFKKFPKVFIRYLRHEICIGLLYSDKLIPVV